MISSRFKTAPKVRPAFPIGCNFDIPTGSYVRGNRGQWILMGGQNYLDNISGPGNTFKTEIIIYRCLTLLARYPSITIIFYDTENTLNYERLQRRKEQHPELRETDFDFYEEADKAERGEDARFILVGSDGMTGDAFFETLRKLGEERAKDKKRIYHFDVPFADGNLSSKVDMYVPIDTLSTFMPSQVETDYFDANAIGDKKNTTLYMRAGLFKSTLMIQLPNMGPRNGIMMSLSAHMGELGMQDSMAPPPLRLSFTKRNQKHKNVPESFKSYSNNLFEAQFTQPLYNSSSDKSPKYPDNEFDMDINNDMMLITFVSTRNKQGASGTAFPTVVSQREGVLPHLTQFHYVRTTGKGYGLDISNDKRWFILDLYPDGGKVQRTTIRKKIDEDYRFRRAIEITAELFQMSALWSNPPEWTPATMRKRLEELGYDWNELLNTRSWEGYIEDQEAILKLYGRQPLSTMDLCMMCDGEYHPYWMPEKPKAA